ncbi:MAG: DUF4296 domain-containing protein [Chitinophagaceae bacterium]
MRKLVALVIIVFALGCKNTKQPKLLTFNTMKMVMYDMMLSDVYFRQAIITDSLAAKRNLNLALYNKVFEQHKITKEQFYKSFDDYLAKPAELAKLMDSLEVYANARKNAINTTPVHK